MTPKKPTNSSRRAANKAEPKNTSKRTAPNRTRKGKDASNGEWDLVLYVAGQTPKSIQALDNLRKLCEIHLGPKYRIRVIDLMEKPQLARADQIVAIPTLVRKLPVPVRKIIGDLSNTERVLVGLNVESPRGV